MTVKRTWKKRQQHSYFSRMGAHVRSSRPDYLLSTSRYDLLHDWTKTVARLRCEDRVDWEEDFSIFLEDWPQLKHRFTSKEIMQDVKYSSYLNRDILHCITYTHTVIVWRFKGNAKEIQTERLTFPTTMIALLYINERRVYLALDQNANLLMMAREEARGKIEIAGHIDNVYNATCLAYIKETKQIVVGGVGYLKFYAILAGKEGSTKISSAKDTETSLGKDECVRYMQLDTVNRRLNVLTYVSVIMVNYETMTEIRRFSEKKDTVTYITCCCLYRKNEYFITGNSMGEIRVWNPQIFTEVHEFKGHQESISAVKTSSARALLLSASVNGWVYIWRLDVFKDPLQKIRVDEVVIEMGLTSEHNALGFWCFTNNGIVVYEYSMFSVHYAYMDSTVYKLQRILGNDQHPNRILVATEDGGLRHLNPVTGTLIGYMFPMTSLYLVQQFAYNSFRGHTYLVMGEGSVLVLDCSKSPFRGVEVFDPSSADEAVTCITGGLLSLGKCLQDIVIFAGYRNGQIQIMASDLFLMPRPLQAHHAPVECLDMAACISTSGDEAFRSNKALVSAGADYAIKVWKILCKPLTSVGLDIRLQLMAQVRCETCPKFLAVTEERVCVIYRNKHMLDMYDISPHSQSKTPPRLNHTPDYDHTHTVTSLQKCPLLRIFATSSLDCTIKIWDDQNELVRELIFLTPVADCCFASDMGDLLSASGNILRLTSPDKYLPWSYLAEMKRKTFRQTTESKEMEFPYKANLKSWIDPSRLRTVSLPNRPGWQQSKPKKKLVTTEPWEMACYGPQGRRMLITVPIPMRHHRRQATAAEHEETDIPTGKRPRRQPQLSVVMPHTSSVMIEEGDRLRLTSTLAPSAAVSATSSNVLSATGSEQSSTNRAQFSRQSSAELRVIEEEQDLSDGDENSAQDECRLVEDAFNIVFRKRQHGEATKGGGVGLGAGTSPRGTAADDQQSLSEEGSEIFKGISEAEKILLEGLGVVSSVPKCYNILRREGDYFSPPEESRLHIHHGREEEEENEEEEEIRGDGISYKGRRGYASSNMDLDTTNRKAVVEQVDIALRDVEESKIEAYQRSFLLSFGRRFCQAVLSYQNVTPDDLADRSFREYFRPHQIPVMTFRKLKQPHPPASAPPTPLSLASVPKVQFSVLEALQKRVDEALAADPGSEAAQWIERQQNAPPDAPSPGQIKRKKIRSLQREIRGKSAGNVGTTAVDMTPETHRVMEATEEHILKTSQGEIMLEGGLAKLRKQSWFPRDVPSDFDSTCKTWVKMLQPDVEPALLRTVAIFTAQMISSGEMSTTVRELVIDALQKLISSLPVEQALALLNELVNILEYDVLKYIADALFSHSDPDIRARMRQLGKVPRYSQASVDSARASFARSRVEPFPAKRTPILFEKPKLPPLYKRSVEFGEKPIKEAETPQEEPTEKKAHRLQRKSPSVGRSDFLPQRKVTPKKSRAEDVHEQKEPVVIETKAYEETIPDSPPGESSLQKSSSHRTMVKGHKKARQKRDLHKRRFFTSSKGIAVLLRAAVHGPLTRNKRVSTLKELESKQDTTEKGNSRMVLEPDKQDLAAEDSHHLGDSLRTYYESTYIQGVHLVSKSELLEKDHETSTGNIVTGVEKGVTGVEKDVEKGVTGVEKGVTGVEKGETTIEMDVTPKVTPSQIPSVPTDAFMSVKNIHILQQDHANGHAKTQKCAHRISRTSHVTHSGLQEQMAKTQKYAHRISRTSHVTRSGLQEQMARVGLLKEVVIDQEKGESQDKVEIDQETDLFRDEKTDKKNSKEDTQTSKPQSAEGKAEISQETGLRISGIRVSPFSETETSKECSIEDRDSSDTRLTDTAKIIIDSLTGKVKKPYTSLPPKLTSKLSSESKLQQKTGALEMVLHAASSKGKTRPIGTPSGSIVAVQDELSTVPEQRILIRTPSTGQVPPTSPSASYFAAEKPDMQQTLPVVEKLKQEREQTSLEPAFQTRDFKKSEKYKRLSFLCEKYDPDKSPTKDKADDQPGWHKKVSQTMPRGDRPRADYTLQQEQGHHGRLNWLWKMDSHGQFYKSYQPVMLWNSKTLKGYRQFTAEKAQFRDLKQTDAENQRRILTDEEWAQIRNKSSSDIEASDRLVKRQTRDLSLADLQSLQSDYPWTEGEDGLRVARGIQLCSSQAVDSEPSGPIVPLKGRMGMVTVKREEGASNYGKLRLLWTTKVPRIPVSDLRERVRQLEERGPHHRAGVSRVPPALAHSDEFHKDMGGGGGGCGRYGTPVQSVGGFSSDMVMSSAVDQESEVKLPKLTPGDHSRRKEETSFPWPLLENSSFRFLPSSVQNHVLNRLRCSKFVVSSQDAAQL